MKLLGFKICEQEVTIPGLAAHFRALPRKVIDRFNAFVLENGETSACFLNLYFCGAEIMKKGYNHGLGLLTLANIAGWKIVPWALKNKENAKVQQYVGLGMTSAYFLGSMGYAIAAWIGNDSAGVWTGGLGMGGNILSVLLRTVLDPDKYKKLNLLSTVLRAGTCSPLIVDGFLSEPTFIQNVGEASHRIARTFLEKGSSFSAKGLLDTFRFCVTNVCCSRVISGLLGGFAPVLSQYRLSLASQTPPKNQLA